MNVWHYLTLGMEKYLQNLQMFVLVEPFTLLAQALETNLVSFETRMTHSNVHVLSAVCTTKLIHV
jgi:hypothetical protein